MKKLTVLAVLVFVVLAGAWVGCRCAPLVSPTPVEEPTSVIEPTPTERIEEPTPTPVPPTPTPVPPTPTPEPTATPSVDLSGCVESVDGKYLGCPPETVRELREFCLEENPNSLCLPLPVDPTLPGFSIGEGSYHSDYWGETVGILNIGVSSGTPVLSPIDGGWSFWYYVVPDGGEGATIHIISSEGYTLKFFFAGEKDIEVPSDIPRFDEGAGTTEMGAEFARVLTETKILIPICGNAQIALHVQLIGKELIAHALDPNMRFYEVRGLRSISLADLLRVDGRIVYFLISGSQ